MSLTSNLTQSCNSEIRIPQDAIESAMYRYNVPKSQRERVKQELLSDGRSSYVTPSGNWVTLVVTSG